MYVRIERKDRGAKNERSQGQEELGSDEGRDDQQDGGADLWRLEDPLLEGKRFEELTEKRKV